MLPTATHERQITYAPHQRDRQTVTSNSFLCPMQAETIYSVHNKEGLHMEKLTCDILSLNSARPRIIGRGLLIAAYSSPSQVISKGGSESSLDFATTVPSSA